MKYTQAVQKHQDGTLLKLVGTENWKVATEFVWYIDYTDKTRNFVIVEKGFETNFGSIPRLLRPFLSPTRYTAYILHDFLYRDKAIILSQDKEFVHAVVITRKEADLILIDALEVEKMGRIGRFCVYV